MVCDRVPPTGPFQEDSVYFLLAIVADRNPAPSRRRLRVHPVCCDQVEEIRRKGRVHKAPSNIFAPALIPSTALVVLAIFVGLCAPAVGIGRLSTRNMTMSISPSIFTLLISSAAALAVVGDPGVDSGAAGTNGTTGTPHKYWTSEGCSALEKDADSGERTMLLDVF